MLEFIISNYILFIVAAIVLLLGLFGYMIDKKKYKQYHEEIVNESKAMETLENQPDIQNVATPVAVDNVENSNNETQIVTGDAPVIESTTQNVPEIGQN